MMRNISKLKGVGTTLDMLISSFAAVLTPMIIALLGLEQKRLPVRVEASRRVNGFHVKENANRRHARGRDARGRGGWEQG